MEDYAAKMALKSDAALREYVMGHAQYREGAVLAALNELRQRGQPAAEDAGLRPSLEVTVQEQQTAAAAMASLTAKTGEAVPESEQPVLYTPGVIVLFSVLFNTIAGAVLLAMNLHQLKRTRAIWGLAAFVALYLVGEWLLINTMVQKGAVNPMLLSILNLPAILAYVLWFWPRYVGTYRFQSRSWLVPLLVCLVVMVGLGLLGRYAMQNLPGAENIFKQSMQQ